MFREAIPQQLEQRYAVVRARLRFATFVWVWNLGFTRGPQQVPDNRRGRSWMTKERAEDALRKLRDAMGRKLYDRRGRLRFPADTGDLVQIANIVGWGLGEISSLDETHDPSHMLRAEMLSEKLRADGQRLIEYVTSLRDGQGTLALFLELVYRFVLSADRVGGTLIGRGDMESWFSTRRTVDAFLSRLWVLLRLALTTEPE